MTIRIDWIAIRTYYLSSEASLKSCSEKFNVNYGSLRQKASDQKWNEHKERVRRNALSLLDNNTSEEIARRNQAHIRIAQELLTKAMEALDAGVRPQNARELILWVKIAIAIERECLGLEQPGQSKVKLLNDSKPKYKFIW